ncbi:type II toxin-antitoxin system PemK/MazF family toxin [Zwartia sp.]|uniref:type II toxin-antitoxin system PemK/MazF family toxin n=1 Tax=Zwartia sp. TaxID=2978004 RepID=UPI003BAEC057
MRWWSAPTAGEIVWCHFPDAINHKPKARPSLIITTKEDDLGQIYVTVAYGTSQKLNRLFSGEFQITKAEHPAAYISAGLSYDTKFDFRNTLELPFNDVYFSVPAMAPFGQNPQLGILHPSMTRIAAAAFSAARKNLTI